MALLSRFDVFSRSAGRSAVPRQDAGRQLRRLLAEADAQDAAAGRAAWLARAVEHLVPDEARILAVLADESDDRPGRALVHIHCMTPTGAGRGVRCSRTSPGSATPRGLALPQLVPYYVGRLLALDLAEIGPEDPRLEDDYPALLAEPQVLARARPRRAGRASPPG